MRATKRQSDEATKGSRRRCLFPSSLRRFVAASLLLPTLSACTYQHESDSMPTSTRQKQEDLINNPMSYKSEPNENVKPYDISGGGVNNLDKGALKRDLDHVLNP